MIEAVTSAADFWAGWAGWADLAGWADCAGLAFNDMSPNRSVMGDSSAGSGTGDMLNMSSSASNSSSVNSFLTGFFAGDFLATTFLGAAFLTGFDSSSLYSSSSNSDLSSATHLLCSYLARMNLSKSAIELCSSGRG